MALTSFRQIGFAVFPGILSEAELRDLVDSIVGFNSVGSRCLLQNLWCQQTALKLRERLAYALPELLQLHPVQCTFFNKSASANWFVAFHQDRSIPVSVQTAPTYPGWSRKEGAVFVQPPSEVLDQLLALRLHLDDCGAENGPLCVVPNSHGQGILSTQQIEASREQHGSVELTVPRGGVVAMRPLLLHASRKSDSPQPRRVLHFLFGPSQLPDGLAWPKSS